MEFESMLADELRHLSATVLALLRVRSVITGQALRALERIENPKANGDQTYATSRPETVKCCRVGEGRGRCVRTKTELGGLGYRGVQAANHGPASMRLHPLQRNRAHSSTAGYEPHGAERQVRKELCAVEDGSCA